MKPRRGEASARRRTVAAWRLGMTSETDHSVGARRRSGSVAGPSPTPVALLLSEVPEDYDLLYLCVPPRYRVDEKGEGRVVRASVPALSAYVASKTACGKLLDLCRGLDRPLDEFVAAAGLATFAARVPARSSPRAWRRRSRLRPSLVLYRRRVKSAFCSLLLGTRFGRASFLLQLKNRLTYGPRCLCNLIRRVWTLRTAIEIQPRVL